MSRYVKGTCFICNEPCDSEKYSHETCLDKWV